jgi:hypothetical protein
MRPASTATAEMVPPTIAPVRFTPPPPLSAAGAEVLAGVLLDAVCEPEEVASLLLVVDGTMVRVVRDDADAEDEVPDFEVPVDDEEPAEESLWVAEPGSVGVARLLGLCVKLMRSLVSETGAAAPAAPAETTVARSLAVPHPNCEYPPSNMFL